MDDFKKLTEQLMKISVWLELGNMSYSRIYMSF